MYCAHCGEWNSPGTSNCGHCGQPLLPAPGITGSRPVTISTTWELRFTRVARKPAGL